MVFTTFFIVLIISLVHGQNNIISLYKNNFANGTYRIKSSGYYRLEEDIIFNPNANSDLINANSAEFAWLPNNNDAYPTTKGTPFYVGYFAAITIETSNVIIDLNGHSIAMHDHFYMQQRFFSNIDVNAPFEAGTGPASFGSVIPISNIEIKNGIIGKSSHQGIHLNSVSNVKISNIKIRDFEVGGIQINNFQNVEIDNVEIGPSCTSLYNNVYYGNARFNLFKLRKIAARNGTATIKFSDRTSPVSVNTILSNLIKSMNLYFKYVHVDGNPDINNLPMTRQNVEVRKAYNLFNNGPSNLPDGASLYGIVANSYGPPVFGFGNSPRNSSNLLINNVYIHDLQYKVREVMGYYPNNNNKSPMRGAFNDVIDMNHICLNNSNNNNISILNCSYQGNVLSDAQIAIAMLGKSSLDEIGLSFVNNDFKNWLQSDIKLNVGNIRCGGDVMTHTIKGIIGIRLDNIINGTINNSKIENITNPSLLGFNQCGSYQVASDIGAVYGISQGFMGTHIRGIITVNSDDVMLENIQMKNFQSNYGDVMGIDIIKNSIIIMGNNLIDINNLNAGNNLTSLQANYLHENDNPNHLPRVCGVHFDDSSIIALMGSNNPDDHTQINNIRGYVPCYNEFQANDVTTNSI